ncbi:hypothetical protein JCM33374_g1513 [Metschnikowia sp. JCM 33374]|nr:hypothetical protein JCM33374_g1513 [Metschnikowia sp. JCM 33374]
MCYQSFSPYCILRTQLRIYCTRNLVPSESGDIVNMDAESEELITDSYIGEQKPENIEADDHMDNRPGVTDLPCGERQEQSLTHTEQEIQENQTTAMKIMYANKNTIQKKFLLL